LVVVEYEGEVRPPLTISTIMKGRGRPLEGSTAFFMEESQQGRDETTAFFIFWHWRSCIDALPGV
jgi:hypothetical protein